MEFIPGFKWALPKAFSDAVFGCRFEEGDMLYQTSSAYKTDWSKKELDYFIQVVYPSRGGSKTTGEAAVFEKNWKSEGQLCTKLFIFSDFLQCLKSGESSQTGVLISS